MTLYYIILTDHMKNAVTSLNEFFISTKQAAYFGTKAKNEIPPCGGFRIRKFQASPKDIRAYMNQKLHTGQINLEQYEQQFNSPAY